MVQPFLIAESVWIEVKDGNDTARELYDAHYSRHRHADGRKPLLFVGPGEKMVLLNPLRAGGIRVWSPGWRVDADMPRDLLDASGKLLATFYPMSGGDEDLALRNARLAVAALKMYEALEALPLEHFNKDDDSIDAAEFKDHAADFMRAMGMARAALALARGEQL